MRTKKNNTKNNTVEAATLSQIVERVTDAAIQDTISLAELFKAPAGDRFKLVAENEQFMKNVLRRARIHRTSPLAILVGRESIKYVKTLFAK